MASRAHRVLPCLDSMEPERPPPALVSELLEEIFLCVASPADLARASAACVSFRRLIADPSFLRRYRSIHPPLLLGLVSFPGFHPVGAPHSSAAVARAVALAADFSFDYLPCPTTEQHYRRLCDVSNGLVLIEDDLGGKNDLKYHDFVVCDPLSWRYVMLPRISDDLLAFVDPERQIIFNRGVSLIPSGGIEEDTSFSVIYWIQSNTMLGVFVFSSVSGCWSVRMSTNCKDLGLNKLELLVSGQYYGCFYWKLVHMSMLIKLDMNTMQFCIVDLPPDQNEREIVIVESRESKAAMFSFSYSYEGTSVDYYTFSQNGSEKSHEWNMMRTIPLPAHYTFAYCIGCYPAEGYIFIECLQDGEEPFHLTVFSLEVKSLNIERVCGPTHNGPTYPYFGFPPSMSPRRFQGYGEFQD